MSKNRGLGRSWGCVGRVLEPSGPKGPPGCTLGCENHVRGSPFGDGFLYNLRSFLYFFVVFSTMHPERHFIDFYTISDTFPKAFGEVFGKGWK